MNKFEMMSILSDSEISTAAVAAQLVIGSAPESIRRVGLDPEISTQTQARNALRAVALADRGPLTSAVARVTEIWGARNRIDEIMEKIARRLAVTLPTQEPAEFGPEALQNKLETIRVAAVWDALCSADYRLAAHHNFYVGFGTAAVEQEEYADWNMYSKGFGHPGRIQDTTLTVPSDWRVRIERRGLGVLDGILTVDAVLLDARVAGPEKFDVKIYAAVWLAQGRGTELHTESGFLAVSGGTSYHSLKSPDDAARGIIRKVRADRLDIVLGRAGLSGLVVRALSVAPDLTVKWSDAKAIGACTPGILSWCHRAGIDPEAGEVPLRDVYEAYRELPASEARGAILRAIRSNVVVRRALISQPSPKDTVAAV